MIAKPSWWRVPASSTTGSTGIRRLRYARSLERTPLKVGDRVYAATAHGQVAAEGGILLTKTLLISYLSKWGELGGRTPGTFLRAFDKSTGELAGEVDVETRLHGAPMTYMHCGRQYIAVAGGGRAAVLLAVVSISGW